MMHQNGLLKRRKVCNTAKVNVRILMEENQNLEDKTKPPDINKEPEAAKVPDSEIAIPQPQPQSKNMEVHSHSHLLM